MIYTSYFSRCDQLEDDGIVPIAICGGIPSWYNGCWYRRVAPSWSIYSEYKETGDHKRYTERFQNEILSKLNQEQVYQDLYNLAGECFNFAMICYEKPNEFCHRHLVADWLAKKGFSCMEWKAPDEF